ncbi:MAG: PAS domain-containing protein [Candidatus Cloacimonetes bacterium]|nr:PAS domain-containing protein [Candidatus Cloacimonadota bacterium]
MRFWTIISFLFIVVFLAANRDFQEIPERCQAEADSLKILLPQAQKEAKLRIINRLIELYGRYDNKTAIDYFIQAQQIHETCQDYKLIGDSYFNIFRIYEIIGEKDEVMKQMLSGMHFYKKSGDQRAIARGHCNLASFYITVGYYESSLRHIAAGLSILEKHPDSYLKSWLIILKARALAKEKCYSEAIKVYKQGIEMVRESEDKPRLANLLLDYSQLYMTLEQYARAMELNLEAAELLTDSDAFNIISLQQNNLGWLYLQENRMQEALDANLKALEYRRKAHRRDGVISTLRNIGNLYLDWGKLNMAEKYFLETIREAEGCTENCTLVIKALANKNLSELYERKENYSKALKFYLIYHEQQTKLEEAKKQEEVARLKNAWEISHYQAEKEGLIQETKLIRISIVKQRWLLVMEAAVMTLLLIIALLLRRRILVNRRMRQELEQTVASSTLELKNVVFQLEQEIEQKEKMSEDIRVANERYNLISKSVQMYMWTLTLTPSHEVESLFLSPAFCEITGISSDEFIADPATWDTIIHKDDVGEFRKSIQELISNPATNAEVDARIYNNDGDIRWTRYLMYSELLEDSTCRISGVCIDTTQVHEIEEKFQKLQRRFENLVNEATVTIGIVIGNDICFINPAGLELFGFAYEELYSQPFISFIHPDDRQRVIEMHRKRVMGFDVPTSYQMRICRKDGQLLWIEIKVTSIEWEEQEAQLVFLQDITGRLEADEKQKQLVEELQATLTEVKELSGMLPICSHCKKIRDDSGYWQNVEVYMSKHTKAEFSHGLCPDCVKKFYSDIADSVLKEDE